MLPVSPGSNVAWRRWTDFCTSRFARDDMFCVTGDAFRAIAEKRLTGTGAKSDVYDCFLCQYEAAESPARSAWMRHIDTCVARSVVHVCLYV